MGAREPQSGSKSQDLRRWPQRKKAARIPSGGPCFSWDVPCYGEYVIVRVPATLEIVTVMPCVKYVGYVSLATVLSALT